MGAGSPGDRAEAAFGVLVAVVAVVWRPLPLLTTDHSLLTPPSSNSGAGRSMRGGVPLSLYGKPGSVTRPARSCSTSRNQAREASWGEATRSATVFTGETGIRSSWAAW